MSHRDNRGRFCRPQKTVNRPTLVTILRIEACRAGLRATELALDTIELRCQDKVEKLSLADACAVVAMLRGTDCSPHIIKAGGLKIISP